MGLGANNWNHLSVGEGKSPRPEAFELPRTFADPVHKDRGFGNVSHHVVPLMGGSDELHFKPSLAPANDWAERIVVIRIDHVREVDLLRTECKRGNKALTAQIPVLHLLPGVTPKEG